MTDTPTSAPLPTDSDPSTDPPRRWDWRPKARWFAAEIVVVVAGILIALAINAWWSGRQSAAQERVYLQQLAADLDASARRLESSVDAMAYSMEVSSKLLIAFSEPERASPDSVGVWLTNIVRTDRPGLALGVARALTSTDLAVVRDDSVRTAIFDLLTHAERYYAWDGPSFATFIDYANQLRAVIPMTTRISLKSESAGLNWYYPVLPFGVERRVAYPLDVDAFLHNREAYTAIDGIYDMSADMRVFQTVTRNRVRDVLELLERRGIALEADTGADGG